MNTQQMHWMQDYGVLCCIKIKKEPSYVRDKFGIHGRRLPQKNKELQNAFGNRIHDQIKKIIMANNEIKHFEQDQSTTGRVTLQMHSATLLLLITV